MLGVYVSDRVGFALYDSQEQMRLSIYADQTEPALTIHDETGQVRVFLGHIRETATLGIYDILGQKRAWISHTELGPMVGLSDEEQDPRFNLMVHNKPRDLSALSMHDDNGKLRGLFMIEDGDAKINILDPNGNPGSYMGHTRLGAAVGVDSKEGSIVLESGSSGVKLDLSGPNEKVRASLNLGKDQVGVRLSDHNGTRRLEAKVDETGPSISRLDATGSPMPDQ
jgi:hypothetical protein